ncbi:ATP-binding protein [Streptomyces chumphonensis]|uniref:ATP-binding protein n=1 Tax=Streptomyces chumphonensis TaxID=1214925 RepID=UPI003D749FEF
MISHPAPSRHCAVEFQALPSRIGQVRRIVSAQLRYWHLPQLTDTAALGVTELLANVHRHTGADKHCTVEIVLLWDRLTISVRDHDPRLPEVRSPGTTATSGRGLALVAAMSASWGMRAQRGGEGKVVWFTLPAPPPGERRPTGIRPGAGSPSVARPAAAPSTAAVREPGRASPVPG